MKKIVATKKMKKANKLLFLSGVTFTCSALMVGIAYSSILHTDRHLAEVEAANQQAYDSMEAMSSVYVADVQELKNEIDKLKAINAEQNIRIEEQNDLIDTYDQKFDDLHKEVDAYTKVLEREAPKFQLPTTWKGAKSTKANGGVYGPSGQETYYNLPMDNCVANMRKRGYDAKRYPVWTRKDGAKMFGHYVMVAANWKIRPLGTVIETSIGWGIVVDTGTFVKTSPRGVDLAVNW